MELSKTIMRMSLLTFVLVAVVLLIIHIAGIIGELAIKEVKEERMIEIKDVTRNLQKLRQIVNAEIERTKDYFSLLTVVRLWKLADKIS